MSETIQRYTYRERVMHWLTALTYTYCLATGLAFYTPYLFWIAIVLGGGATSRYWHPVLGSAFFLVALWMHSTWRRDMGITETDKRWLDRSKDYINNRDDALPPQERFNGGQKLFYWLMYYGALLLLLSGAFMWFPEYTSVKVAWVRALMIMLHEIAALLTIGGFIIHIYMSLFLVPGSVGAMTTGYVTKAWAKAHHRLWYIRVTGGEAAPKE
jgi:formate dehydrogenase subunit gamma